MTLQLLAYNIHLITVLGELSLHISLVYFNKYTSKLDLIAVSCMNGGGMLEICKQFLITLLLQFFFKDFSQKKIFCVTFSIK